MSMEALLIGMGSKETERDMLLEVLVEIVSFLSLDLKM